MSGSEVPVPLSAVALRLADEVGQAVLDRIDAGDLAGAAELDQHVAAVRAELAVCQPAQVTAARRAGQAARPAASGGAARAGISCPAVPFADNPWRAEAAPPLRLLLHYACGFTEAAVRADWWPAEPPAVSERVDWPAMRLAAILRLIRLAESAAALHPDLR